MKIDAQLKTAARSILRQVHMLPSTWPLSRMWFRDIMTDEVFGYLLQGRIRHDAHLKPCTFQELWSALRHTEMNYEFRPGGSYLADEFSVHLDNLEYVVWERTGGSWHAEPVVSNSTRIHIPASVRLTAESFLRFLEEFEEAVPFIYKAADDLDTAVARERTVDVILENSLEAVLADTFDAVGIRYTWEYRNEDLIFRFPVQGHSGIRVRIPVTEFAARIQELPALLADPEEGIRRYGKDFRYERMKR